MNFLGFESSQTDPYIWMQKLIRKYEVTEYYEYVLLYNDDYIVIIDRGEAVLRN